MDFYNEYVLQNHLESALKECENVIKRGDKWQFRCNICGDSKKSKSKRRGWLLKNRKGIWIFNCFNDCGSMGALNWLKVYFPEQYKSYIMEVLSKKKLNYKKEEPKNQVLPVTERPPKNRISFPFLSVSADKNKDVPLVQIAIDFCQERKIPSEIWSKFFVCEKDKYSGRLIIPFYNKENKIYYFQARTLTGIGEKYISAEGEKKIYNIFNVDKSKPVMITEGMIDSMFLENSIAIAGLRFGESVEVQLKELKPYFLLDYDKPGQTKSLQLLKQGRYVFNWSKFQKEKYLPKRDKWDLNEVILYLNKDGKFTFNELEKYFTKDYLDSIYFN